MVVYYDDFYSESPIATEPDTMKSYLDKDSIVKNKVPLSDWEYINSHIQETHKHKNSIPEPPYKTFSLKSYTLYAFIDIYQ